MNIYFIMSVGGVAGILLHAFVAVLKINKSNKNVNIKQVFMEYWKSDKLSIIFSAFCFLLLLFVSSEFIDLNSLEDGHKGESLKERLFHFKLASFIKTSSIIAGFFADYIVYGFIGKAAKNLEKQFADKTP